MKSRIGKYHAEVLRIALFRFDNEQLLEHLEGCWNDFTEHSESYLKGKQLSEIFPFLHGIDTQMPQELPFIEVFDKYIIDITLKPDAEGFDLLFINSGMSRDKLQEIQQIANESVLREQRLLIEAERLEIENRAKSRFIASFSHELYTPLSSIIGYSERLLHQHKVDTDSFNQLEAIHRNSLYLRNMIDNILDQHRMDIHQVNINLQLVSLEEIVNDVLKILGTNQCKPGVEYTTIWKCKYEPLLLLDKQHVIQVLINILSNAFKYTKQGNVTLEISQRSETVIFTVTDTGIGIPKHELDKVQVNYLRASNADAYPGTGIGLSLSRQLVNLMHGEMLLDSTLGEGTKVQVKIPYKEDTRESKPMAGNRVLMVDDDPDILAMTEYYLNRDNIEFTGIADAQNALAILENKSFDLVIVDYYLDGDSGINLIQQIRDNSYRGKIVMITASTETSIKNEALSAGCDGLLIKPISNQRILAHLVRH